MKFVHDILKFFKFAQNHMNEKNIGKINIKIVMYPCTNFQLFCRTADFGNKFAPKKCE